MKIVFLTSSYYPFFSAIGRCVKNIVEEIENDHEVIVISNMSKVNLNDNESYCNHEIIRIRPKNLLRRDVLNQNEHPKSSKMLNYFFRVIDYLQFVCSKQSVQKELTNEYLNELKKIENIDLIVPNIAILASFTFLLAKISSFTIFSAMKLPILSFIFLPDRII